MTERIKRAPYPLQWPEGWTRTKFRDRPKFGAMFARDRDTVLRGLRKRGSHVVITSDLPTGNNGLPYANARCDDPGIAVWWVEKGHERVIACDRWSRIDFNMRAIELTLKAMRGLERWGAGQIVERAFAGFAALPPGAGASAGARPKRSWREIFDMPGSEAGLDGAERAMLVKARHRKLMQEHHPDHGGDGVLAADLNVALAEALEELEA